MTQSEVNLCIVVAVVVVIGTVLGLWVCCAMAGMFKRGGKADD